jgi:acetate---CoA ligase (ADP-forming) subunit alpha
MDFDFDEIETIINARSIAIVGASGKPMKFGSLYTLSQMAYGFSGDMYLVNPNETEIAGQPVFPDLRSLPEVPQLVYITIPAAKCLGVLEECAEVGVKGVVILASGFREAGEEGKRLEKQALEVAHAGGFRMIGPNCFGIYNPRNGLTLLPGHDFSKQPGGLAFISQSGGFSAHVGRLCKGLKIGFSAIVSYGNATDIDESDLLRYFAQDPQTRIIGAYLEGVADGRRFLKALREAAASKTVFIWKVGKSAPSRRAVASHTGSLAGSADIWGDVVTQAGAIEVSGVEELCDAVLAAEHLGRKPGKRLMLVGGGGGLGTHGADLAEAAGLRVPALDEVALERSRSILSQAGAAVGNPMDIGAPLVPLPLFKAAMREAASQDNTDIILFDMALNFAYGLGGEEGLDAASDILIAIRKEAGKPLVSVLYSRADSSEDLELEGILRRQKEKLLSNGVPVYPSMARALKAISLANS